MKKIVWLGMLGLFLMGAGQVRAWSSKPYLQLRPSSEGNRVAVEVVLKPGNHKISGVETEIKFDPEKLKFVDYKKTELLPVEVIKPQVEGNKIHFALAIGPSGAEVAQSGKVVELDFERVGEGGVELATTNSMITSLEAKGNIVDKETSIKISNGAERRATNLVSNQGGKKLSWWQKLLIWLKNLIKF